MKRMKQVRVGIVAFVLLALPVVSPGVAEAAEKSQAWQAEWEKTLQAAEKEGQVTLYGSSVYEEVFREFRKRYPKIKVNHVIGRGADVSQRILNERRAGRYLTDLFVLGASTGYNFLYKGKVLDPIKPALILPEVRDESLWWKGKHRYMDDDGEYLLAFNEVVLPFLAYNTKQAAPGEIRSYWDLLQPKWKGRIVGLDPTMGSAVDTHLVFIYHNPNLGPEFLRRLLGEMDLAVSRDTRQIVDWLATGKYSFSVFTTPSRADLSQAKQQGLGIDWIPPKEIKEGAGTSSSNGNVALLNRAPHPNAAKVALNWLLSREGQIAYQRFQFGSDSLRTDIPKDNVASYARRAEGVQYVETDSPERRNMAPIQKIVDEVWKKRR